MCMALKGKATIQWGSRCLTSRLFANSHAERRPLFHSKKAERGRLVMEFEKLPTLRLSSDGPMR